jgi:hypothetical protein
VLPLKRWCAARVHDRAYRHWVVFRFPETLDYWNLVDTHPASSSPGVVGPDWRLRKREGFKLTDPRMNGREVLSEIPLLRAVPRARQGFVLEGTARQRRKGERQSARHRIGGCPLGEKISEMHTLRKQGDAIGALALVAIDNPMCPGTATASATTA